MTPPRSIRLLFWLPALVAAAFLVLVLTSALLRYRHEASAEEALAQRVVKHQVAHLQRRIEQLLKSGADGGVAEAVAQVGAYPAPVTLALVHSDGRILAASLPVLVGRPVSLALPAFDSNRIAQARNGRRLLTAFDSQRQHLLAYQPISMPASAGQVQTKTTGALLLTYDLMASKAEARRAVMDSMLTELAIALLVMAALMFMMWRWLAQPLRHLQHSVNRVGQGDFNTPAGVQGRGELATLGAAVDGMLADLASAATAREQHVEALRISEQRFRAIVAAEPECVKVVSADGQLLEMNAAGLAMLEADSLAQAKSHGLMQFLLPEYRAAFAALHRNAIAGRSGLLEFEIVGLRGTRRWLETHAAPLPGADGRVAMMLGITRDVTENKLAQSSLRNSESRFRRIMESNLIGLMFWDSTGSISDANEAFLSLVGYTRDDVREGRVRWTEMTPREYRSLDENALQELATSGSCQPFEKEFVDKDGARVPVLIGAVCFPEQPDQGIAFVLDISARKHAERWRQHYSDTLDMISAEAPTADILTSLTRFSERTDSEMICSILLLSADGNRLSHGAAPSLPDFFNKAIDGAAIGPTAGSCGVAAFTRELVITEDISLDPNWEPWRDLAARAGLRSCWSHPILSSEGQVLGTFAIYHRYPSVPQPLELSLIRQSAGLASIALERAKLHDGQRLARVVFEQSIEGIMVTDTSDRVLMVNSAFEMLTGYPAVEVIGGLSNILDSDREDPAQLDARRKALEKEGVWKGKVWGSRKSGESYPLVLSVSVVNDASGAPSHFISTMSDVSEQQIQLARIEQLAFYDVLTGLPNRALFLDRLEHTLAAAERRNGQGAILFLDLDRFKEINDTLGHAVGDLALAEVARRFQAVSRTEETLARLGGDEFVLIVEDADLDAAVLVAQRLQRTLAAPLDLMGQPFTLGASIGVAFYPQDGKTAGDLIKHTDIAMYRAKASGGGYQLYRAEMGAELEQRLKIAKLLGNALEDGELQLHYQPQIDLASGRLIGAEALLRWHSEAFGWLSPAVFVPIAEERGMMGPLGDWVLRQACRQIHAWEAAGAKLDGRLAVNVSALQMEDPDIAARLVQIVREANLCPDQFELELTESSMMLAPDRAVNDMKALSDAGFKLSIDDFGTGYSSLAYLKRFDTDQIKIDITFVRSMLTNASDFTIVTTIIAMARSLGLKTTAEGVEEEAQAIALRELGCDFAQGYHFGRPEPADRFQEKWLMPHGN